MFRHINCKGTCGSSQCTEWVLARLSTVAEPISAIETEYGLDPKTIAELTGLEKDVYASTMKGAYRNGQFFPDAGSVYGI